MSVETEFRIAGFISAFMLGILLPAWLLGPWLFDGVQLSSLPYWGRVLAFVCAVFGAWLVVVSAFVDQISLQRTLEPLGLGAGGGEVVVLAFPYIVYVGTRGLWRRWRGKSADET